MSPRGKEKPEPPTAKRKRGAPPGPRAYDPAKHCGAQRTNAPKGVLCKRGKGQGTSHPGTGKCDRHLGDSPAHKAAAEKAERAAMIQTARQACSLLGLDVPVEGDPGVVLLLEMERAERAADHWGSAVALLAAAGESIDRDTPALALWMIERKTVADVAAKAQALGLARRRVELEEDMARVSVAVLAEFVRLVGLDRESPEVRAAGVAALQLLPGGSAAA